jgi:dihydroorotase
MTALAICGGRLIDPAAGVDAAKDVLLKDGRVAEIAGTGKLKHTDGAEVLDATGLIVAPGLIDIHVHLREPGQAYKETIATGTAAAAAGGFTSVAAMPNTTPVNDSPEITRWMQAPERGAEVRVFPIAAATRGSKGEALTDFAALKSAGAVAVTDDGRPILKDGMMREALAAAARVGLTVIQHAEDTRMTQGASMNLGPVSFKLGLRGMPAEAERSIVERDIRLVTELREAHPHLHVAHISTAGALAAVRQARRNGLRVTCEVTPHHFLLSEEHVGLYNTHAKMNPPLRSAADREALIEGILDGVVDAIATDHAPHAQHEKEIEFELAPNGMIGLETALGLCLRWLHW